MSKDDRSPYLVNSGDVGAGGFKPVWEKREEERKRSLVGGWSDGAEPARPPAPTPSKDEVGQSGGFANKDLAD